LRLYSKVGNRTGLMPEAVADYAAVLKLLGRNSDADRMLAEFQRTGNVLTIP
jgi:hypothetical protein